jgi:hypothetical protein
LRNWIVRFCKACGHVVIGLARAIGWSILLNKAAIVRSLQQVSLGVGMLTALAGHRFIAYRKAETQQIPQIEMDNGIVRASS